MPKLLYLVTEDWFFCSHFFERAMAMREAGYEVIVAAHVNRHAEAISGAGLRLLPIDFGRQSLHPAREWRTLLAIWRMYRAERPDLVHHIALKPILYGTLAARLLGIRRIVNAPVGMGYIFTSDHLFARFLRPVVQIALRLLLNPPGSRVIVENSDDMRNLARQHLTRLDDTALIRGAGIDLERFQPAPEPPGLPVVTLTARMLWDKGVGEFVEAARMLKAAGVQARFLLVGDVDPANPATIDAAQLRAWQQENIIEWLGYRSDIPDILAMSHIVCLPSYREGLPKSLLEALACGKPLVTTDVPGCREVATDGENGLLVPAKDARTLAAALRRLIENPALRQRFGARGRQRAEEEFASQHIIAQTMRVYNNLLRQDAPPLCRFMKPQEKHGRQQLLDDQPAD